MSKGLSEDEATSMINPVDLREHKAKGCRKEGGQACTYIVSW